MNNKTDISAAFVGSTGVDKLYLGNEVVWQSTPPGPTPYDQQYLTFEVLSAGTIYWERTVSSTPRKPIAYSKDNGSTWVSITSSSSTSSNVSEPIEVSAGDKVMFRGENKQYTISASSYHHFGGTAIYNVYGNIMSLSDGDNFSGQTTLVSTYTFGNLFRGSRGLTSAENLILPATTLKAACYNSMFYGCTSLTTAPALPATTLAQSCYTNMFYDCTSLTTAPALPATTLVSNCYQNMFQGCTSLNTVTCLATNPQSGGNGPTGGWLSRVSSTGTFYKDPNTTSWSRGANGIPTGWTVQDYVDPNAPVLKIAGQSITGTRYGSGDYDWGNLTQYSGTSFTIEVGGVHITADTWDYGENYIDECGESSEISHDTGTTMSVFEVNSGYIGYVYYDPDNNSVSYVSDDDNTSDDPEVICGCQGGCWDGETCQECPQSCEDQGLCDDGEGNCVECEGELVNCSEEWENLGYSSEEECDCVENNMGCEDGDPCDDWEGNGYASYEECTCVEREENCDYCTDWETLGYVSLDDCNCQVLREGCNMCDDWENNGYSSYEECTCEKYGEGCPEEESGE